MAALPKCVYLLGVARLLFANFFHVEDNSCSKLKTSSLVVPCNGLSFEMSLTTNLLPIPSAIFELALCAASRAVLIHLDIMTDIKQAACNMHHGEKRTWAIACSLMILLGLMQGFCLMILNCNLHADQAPDKFKEVFYIPRTQAQVECF